MTENTLGTFYDKEQGKTYEVNEGNVTVSEGYSSLNANKQQKFITFENPVGAENFLEFDFTDDLLVKGATTKATHITMYEPEFPYGKLPTENITDGSYRRFVTAFELKVGEVQLPVSDTNSAIAKGDGLKITDYHSGLDKHTNASEIVALESKPANTGGYIIAYLKVPYLTVGGSSSSSSSSGTGTGGGS